MMYVNKIHVLHGEEGFRKGRTEEYGTHYKSMEGVVVLRTSNHC